MPLDFKQAKHLSPGEARGVPALLEMAEGCSIPDRPGSRPQSGRCIHRHGRAGTRREDCHLLENGIDASRPDLA